MQRGPALLPLLLVVACAEELALPDAPPVDVPPVVTAFDPPSAFAGERVRISGERLGDVAQAIEVRFGSGSTVQASAVVEGIVEAIVPDDATDGRVVVTGPQGRAVSGIDFDFLGLGRLRSGRVTGASDLRIETSTAFPLRDVGGLFFSARQFEWAGLLDRDGVTAFDFRVGAATLSGDGRYFFLVRLQSTRSCRSGFVERREAASPLLTGVSACLDSNDGNLAPPTSGSGSSLPLIASNDTGSLAFVTATDTSWVVDFDRSTPTATEFPMTTGNALQAVTWLGGTGFAAASSNDFHIVDAKATPPVRAFGRPPASPVITAMAALPGVELALGSCLYGLAERCSGADRIERYALDGDLTRLPSVAFDNPWQVEFLAYSPDGRRLLATQPGLGRITTFDRTEAGFPPLATVEAEVANRVLATATLFYVASRGGVTIVSQSTGQRVDDVRLSADLGLPRTRIAECGTTRKQVVELPVRRVNRLRRLEPATLQPDLFGCGLPVLPAGLVVDAPVSEPTGDQLFTTGSDKVWRLGPEQNQSGVLPWVPAGRARPLPPLYRDDLILQLAPGGRALVLVHHAAQSGRDVSVSVLDPKITEWSSLSPTPFTIAGTLDAVTTNASTVLLAGDSTPDAPDSTWTLRRFDLAAAIAGTTTPLGPDLTVTARVAFATSAGARHFVLTADNKLWVVQPDGTLSGPTPFPEVTSYSRVVAAPGGRRLWALGEVGFTDGTGRALYTFIVDPETGALLGQEPNVPLSDGASELVVSPDGTRVVVVDARDDRLWMLD